MVHPELRGSNFGDPGQHPYRGSSETYDAQIKKFFGKITQKFFRFLCEIAKNFLGNCSEVQKIFCKTVGSAKKFFCYSVTRRPKLIQLKSWTTSWPKLPTKKSKNFKSDNMEKIFLQTAQKLTKFFCKRWSNPKNFYFERRKFERTFCTGSSRFNRNPCR